MTEAPVQVAVAGAGLIGRQHIRRILAEPRARLAAIIDPTEAAKHLARECQAPYFQNLDEALASLRMDGLIVASPTQMHVEHALAAVEARVPVLVEKPICGDLDSAERLVCAAEAAQVPILVGHHRRHSPFIEKAREAIQSGRLGQITAVNGMCLLRKPDHGYFDGPMEWRRRPGGGVALINLTHVLDDLRNLCGEIASIRAIASSHARGFEVEDTVSVILEFASGALGTLLASDATAAPWSWEMTSGENQSFPHTEEFCYVIAGTRGSLAVPTLDVWTHEGDGWNSRLDRQRLAVEIFDPLVAQLRHFCRVIRGQEPPRLDGRGGMRTLAATLAVKEAAETGNTILLA